MALYQISGIGCECNQVKDAFGQIELDSIGRRSRAERRARRRERRNRRRYGLNCKGRTGAKIALAIPRKAFLTLVRLNFKKFAVKLHNAIQNPETHKKLMEKWCKLGGKADVLRRNVEKGYNRYKRRHHLSGYEFENESIGVAVETIVASATSVILALLSFLKKGAGEGGETPESTEGGEMSEFTESSDSGTGSGSDSGSDTIEGLSGQNILLIGAGLIGAYYLLKKKK